MATERLIIFLTCSSLLIQYSISQTSNANCTPSSCGLIPNISYPFRLKNDPNNCGDPRAELACENDVAVFYINSQRFYVREINYGDFSIRLSHMHIPTDTNGSICKYFSSYADGDLFRDPDSDNYFMSYRTTPITLISCAYPLQNSSLLIVTQVRDCEEGKHTYLLVGGFNPTDLHYMCTIESMLATSWNFKNISDIVSLSEIHDSLVYGFNLSWFPANLVCGGDIWRRGRGSYVVGRNGSLTCDKDLPSYLRRKWAHVMQSFGPPDGPSSGGLMIFMLVAAVVFGGVSIPAKIVIGFGVSYLILVKHWDRGNIGNIIGAVLIYFSLHQSYGVYVKNLSAFISMCIT